MKLDTPTRLGSDLPHTDTGIVDYLRINGTYISLYRIKNSDLFDFIDCLSILRDGSSLLCRSYGETEAKLHVGYRSESAYAPWATQQP